MTTPHVPSQSARLEDVAAEIAAVQPRLYGFILKRLASREQALEVLQRTNLVLCRKADEYEPGSNFVAWAFTIAKFQVMAWRTSQGRDRLVFTDAVASLVDRPADVEAAAVDLRLPLLKSCLDRLREADRTLIQRRYRDGERVAEIGSQLQKSAEAVGMSLMRIRKQLRDCVRTRLVAEGLE